MTVPYQHFGDVPAPDALRLYDPLEPGLQSPELPNELLVPQLQSPADR